MKKKKILNECESGTLSKEYLKQLLKKRAVTGTYVRVGDHIIIKMLLSKG